MAVLRAVVRGCTLGVVFGLFLFGLLIATGVTVVGPDARYLFVAGAGFGFILGVIPVSTPRIEALGAAGLALVALGIGIVDGFGVVIWPIVAGSLLAGGYLLLGEPRYDGWWKLFRWGGLVVVFLVLALLPLILDGGMLGHDESAYALKARHWLEGTPDTGWQLHRGPALSVYAYPILAMGGAEPALRVIGLVGAAGLVMAVWLLAERLANGKAAALAAIGIVAGPAMLRRSTEFLTDVPAAALLVLCMLVVWRDLGERESASYRLMWVLPPAWVAFYLRYQSALSLVLIAVTVLVLWWPKVRRRPAPLIATLLVGLVGLVPHAVQAMQLTGSPWGLVTHTGGVAIRAYVGEGFLDYLVQTRWALGAFVAPIAIIATLVGLIAGWRARAVRTKYLFLVIPSALQVIGLAIISHGEPRFIFFPFALMVVGGAMTIEHWVVTGGSRVASATAWGLVVLLVGSLAFSVAQARSEVALRSAIFEPIEAAARFIEGEADGKTCSVLTTYHPQMTFYSGCSTELFDPGQDPAAMVDRLSGTERFMILVEPGKRQIDGEARSALIALADGPPTEFAGERNTVSVYEFAR